MRRIKQKIISAVTALSLLTAAIPTVPVQADSLSTNVNEPFHSGVSFTLPNGTSATSSSYRIPAMVTLDNGNIVAAADIRWNTTYDGGGLDTLTARSSDGGVNWDYTVANYLGDNGNTYNGKSSCFIDPCLVVGADGETVYMLVDLYPYGIALNGNGYQSAPTREVGFNSDGHLLLWYGDSTSYTHYLNLDNYYIYTANREKTDIKVNPDFSYSLPAKTLRMIKPTESTEPTEETTAPTEEIMAPTEETTAPTEETTAPTEETAAPTEETTAPTEETTVPTEETTAPTEETTAPTEENTAPTQETTAPTDTTEEEEVSLRGNFWDGLVIKASAAEYDPDEGVAPAAADTYNLFFENSPYKVARTGYLYLTKSTDGGESWGEPELLNLKTSNEQVCLVGPGRGITTSTGRIVIPIYSYNGGESSQRMGFIYSDNGSDWDRVDSTIGTMWSSESAVVELSNGNLRFFFRNGTKQLYYVDYHFNDSSWGAPTSTGIATNSNTQISAITHSQKIDGKQVILVSCPASSYATGSNESGALYRTNGRIFVFTDDGSSMTRINTVNVNDGNFMYSCLTERSDGSVAILYEDTETAWGTGGRYEMEMKAYTASDLGIPFGSETPDDEEPEETKTINISLHVGQTSDPISVSDSEQLGTPGSYTTANGIASYTIIHEAGTDGETTSEILDSLAANQTVVLYSNNNYLKITDDSKLASATELEEATKWTVDTSGNGFTLRNGNTYFGYYKDSQGSYSLNLSTNPTVWNYSADKGFHFSDSDYTRYLYSSSFFKDWRLYSTSGTSAVSSYTSYAYSVMAAGGSGGSTNVTFTGLKPGSDFVTLGDTKYHITVSALEKRVTKNMVTSSTTSLDAIADLGLTGDYTVSYALASGTAATVDTSGTVTSGANAGSAVITATVAKNGTVYGTVTYEVTVNAVTFTESKKIYVPLGGTATISGLSGEINTSMLKTNYATVVPDSGTISNGSITITGNAVGKTAVVVGTVWFDIFVVNKATDTDSKYLYISVEHMDNCDVYYTINGTDVWPVTTTGILVDQTYNGGFHLMFFAAPHEGYALVEMSAEQQTNNGNWSPMHDFYSLSNGERNTDGTLKYPDGSDSDAFPFVKAMVSDSHTIPASGSNEWKSLLNASGNSSVHGFRWSLIEGNLSIAQMRKAFKTALDLGCDSSTNITKNSTDAFRAKFTFRAEKLPELSKEIIGYKRSGEPSDADRANGTLNLSSYPDYFAFDEDVALAFGDTLLYRFTVTGTSTNIQYTNITLRDSKIPEFTPNIPNGTYNNTGIHYYYATYTIDQNKVDEYAGGKFINNAQLNYSYTSRYSTGTYGGNASSEAICDIIGIVSYQWEAGTPEAIVSNADGNYTLPPSFSLPMYTDFNISPYTGTKTYTEKVDGIDVTWTYSEEWGVHEFGNNEKTWFLVSTVLNQPFQMAHSRSITFYGRWLANYSVVYKWVGEHPDVSPPEIISYQSGAQYTVDNDFYEGYTHNDGNYTWTFQGWTLRGSDEICNGTSQTIGSSHVTYTGSWTKVSNATSLSIYKTGCSAADENQSFLFHISGGDLEMDVVINGNGHVIINGLTVGQTYTVTENTDWSWRYTPANREQTITIGTEGNSLAFANTRSISNWLNGNAWCDNRFDGAN